MCSLINGYHPRTPELNFVWQNAFTQKWARVWDDPVTRNSKIIACYLLLILLWVWTAKVSIHIANFHIEAACFTGKGAIKCYPYHAYYSSLEYFVSFCTCIPHGIIPFSRSWMCYLSNGYHLWTPELNFFWQNAFAQKRARVLGWANNQASENYNLPLITM